MPEELELKEKNTEKEPVVKNNSEQKIVKPKFFLDSKKKIECVVNGFYNKETGKIEFAIPGEIKETSERFNVVRHVFWFSLTPYDRLNSYRSQSLIFNPSDRTNQINLLKLREYFWIFHLEDWNFEDEEGNKIEIKKDPNNSLSDETMGLLFRLPANILDAAIGLYEKAINLA